MAKGRTPLWGGQPGAPGGLGALMGDAWVALGNGPDMLWTNPAGLATIRGPMVTADMPLATITPQGRAGATRAGPSMQGGRTGHASYAAPIGGPRLPGTRAPFWAWSTGVATLVEEDNQLRLAQQRPASSTDLMPGQDDPALDITFPGGWSMREESMGHSGLTQQALGLALARAGTEGWRAGLALYAERIELRHSLIRREAHSADNGTDTLRASSLTTAMIAGSSFRLTPVLGIQLDLGPDMALGLRVTMPSEQVAGEGAIRYSRQGSTTLGGGLSGTTTSTLWLDGTRLPFEMQTAGGWQLGWGMRTDWLVFEFDLFRNRAAQAYTMLPGVDSAPPSTTAFRLPALRGGPAGSRGMAAGMAMALTDTLSFLTSLRHTQSDRHVTNALFSPLDVTRLGLGLHYLRGRTGATMGLFHTQYSGEGTPLNAIDGAPLVHHDVETSRYTFRVGASHAF